MRGRARMRMPRRSRFCPHDHVRDLTRWAPCRSASRRRTQAWSIASIALCKVAQRRVAGGGTRADFLKSRRGHTDRPFGSKFSSGRAAPPKAPQACRRREICPVRRDPEADQFSLEPPTARRKISNSSRWSERHGGAPSVVIIPREIRCGRHDATRHQHRR